MPTGLRAYVCRAMSMDPAIIACAINTPRQQIFPFGRIDFDLREMAVLVHETKQCTSRRLPEKAGKYEGSCCPTQPWVESSPVNVNEGLRAFAVCLRLRLREPLALQGQAVIRLLVTLVDPTPREASRQSDTAWRFVFAVRLRLLKFACLCSICGSLHVESLVPL